MFKIILRAANPYTLGVTTTLPPLNILLVYCVCIITKNNFFATSNLFSAKKLITGLDMVLAIIVFLHLE